jgi:hypothetical protein
MGEKVPVLVLVLGASFASVTIHAQNPAPPLTPTAAPLTPTVPKPLQAPVAAAGDPWYAPVAIGGPQNFHGKLMAYAIVTVGPRTLFAPFIAAGIRMANPPRGYPPDWREGVSAYSRNYGNALAPRVSKDTVRFLAGAALHEDFRYRPSTSSNPLVRGFHAFAFAFVDKSDSGNNRLAVANFLGAGASGFVGNLYLPPGFNNLTHAETRTGVAFGGLVAQNLLREFIPDLLKASHKLHAPFPRIPVPEWWVKLPAR